MCRMNLVCLTSMESLQDGLYGTILLKSRVIGAFHHDNPEEMTMLQIRSMTELPETTSFRSRSQLEEAGTCAATFQAGPPPTIKLTGAAPSTSL
jgi:hypothetical protein